MTSVKIKLAHHEKLKGKGKPTYRRGVGKHDERPKVIIVGRHGPKVDRAPRPPRRLLPRKTLTQQLQACQRCRVGILGHLVDAEPPLHEEDDPLLM
jgi:hypothetical protein